MTYSTNTPEAIGARIALITAGSPAARAGLKPGMTVLEVDGEPLRDILDWYWCTDGNEVELEVVEVRHESKEAQDSSFKHTGFSTSEPGTMAAEGSCIEYVAPHPGQDRATQVESMHEDVCSDLVTLSREPGEEWGIEFSEALFDGLRHCVNACSFCFMTMLPKGMRSSLYARDDDYRLSFLQGNFITLTNLSNEDIERIITLHLSPLYVSLHAVDTQVRRHMMGKNQARGIEALELLLAAGIECKVQIVLIPGVNDGVILDETLNWIAARPGIIATGIVPYGYTRFAKVQQGYDTKESAREVLWQLHRREPHHREPQRREPQRREPHNKEPLHSEPHHNESRIQLADEFYIKAWSGEILEHLPPAGYYGTFPMREDGIGMLRQFVDDQEKDFNLAALLLEGQSTIATGEAFAAVLRELWPECKQRILPVKNNFFGGNIDVAGLLTADDVIRQVCCKNVHQLLLPPAMFNDSGLTLDGKSAVDIAETLGIVVKVIDFM